MIDASSTEESELAQGNGQNADIHSENSMEISCPNVSTLGEIGQEAQMQHKPQSYLNGPPHIQAQPSTQQQYFIPAESDSVVLGSAVGILDGSASQQMLLSSQSAMTPLGMPMGSLSQPFPGVYIQSQGLPMGMTSLPSPVSAVAPSQYSGAMQYPAVGQQMPSSPAPPQQQQQQQHHRQGSKKPWHSAEDNVHRHRMAQRIIELLQQKRPNGTVDWQQKLPSMAKKLEEALYSNAASIDEYQDLNTLKPRLQQYAMTVGKSAAAPPAAAAAPTSATPASSQQPNPNLAQSQAQHASGSVAGSQYTPVGAGRPPGVGMAVQQQQPVKTEPASTRAGDGAADATADQSMTPHGSLRQQQDPAQDERSSSANISEEDKLLQLGSGEDAGGDQAAGQGDGVSRSEDHRKQVLKQQQQRLLLLRHASKCHQEVCTVTQHCASMKALWKHIMSCKEQDCKTPHCVSSRYVLSHYSKCKESNCPVCGPVREAIGRSTRQQQEIARSSSTTEGSSTGLSATTEEPEPKPRKPRQGASAKGTGPKAPKEPIVPGDGEAAEPPQIGPDGKPIKAPRKRPPKRVKDGEAGEGEANPKPTKGRPPSQPQQKDPAPVESAASGGSAVAKTDELDPISCSIYGMSNLQIESHIRNIHEGMRMTSAEIKALCMPIVDSLLKSPGGGNFEKPVDPVLWNLPDYFEIVKMPMDLQTLKKKIDLSQYHDPYHVAADFQLMFDNAILYNPKEDQVHKWAVGLKRLADNQFKQAMSVYNSKIEEMKKHPDSCMLCGEQTIKFEPPVYYCEGKCGGARIRRNSLYYSTANNLHHWCAPCFLDLKETIPLPEGPMSKKELALSKKRHAEESNELTEPMVCCTVCDRWAHFVCGLFNSRRNISEDMAFVCPLCILNKRKKAGDVNNLLSSKKMRALDLPHTNLTQYIERKVELRLQATYAERAALLGKPIEEIDLCPQICIRQVASIDKIQQVREGVRERYKHKNYPSEFPCRTKCIILFQNIDGQDVVLFGMYVYEYGHKCPAPNQRRVYVSYLDSVHYFRPRYYRTLVYQEIIVAYLEYVKNRGFHTAHIWACPPLKGDDYILYCHPSDQKTPKDDRLRQWYVDVLKASLERGVVCEISDLYTEFLADPTKDATVLPYFDGDYWINEAEVIIRDLGKTKGKKQAQIEDAEEGAVGGATKSKAKGQSKRTRAAKDIPAIAGTSNRDAVMAKLAAVIQPMKEAFFVARLHPKEYAEKWSNARQAELESEAKDDDPESEAKRARLMEESALDGGAASEPSSSSFSSSKGKRSPPTEEAEAKEAEQDLVQGPGAAAAVIVKEESSAPRSNPSSASGASIVKTKEESSDPMERFKNDLTDDVDDVQDNEFFNTRQDVLNLCQGNHYQFDQLRRAKHSSMMILYHLHNPDAPKFVPSCTLCMKEILFGYRHRCDTCDVDICHTCVTTRGVPASQLHPHPLRPMAVKNGAPVQLTEEQRRERQKSVEMHLHLLRHASNCADRECKSKNCLKMREFLKHGQTCETATKGCITCKKILNLLTLHARTCRLESCGVQRCSEMREQMRQMEMRQQQMDDRRRASMNQKYSNASAPAADPDE